MALNQSDIAVLAPKCASACTAQIFSTGVCESLDKACICANNIFADAVETCVVANCTIRESLAAQNLTSTYCGIDPVANHSFTSIFIGVLAVAGLAVLLRIYARISKGIKLWWDDLFNIIGLLGCVAATISLVEQSYLGLGRNLWAVPQDNVSKILTLSYLNFLLYTISGFLIRESIALFYLRIFGPKKTIIATIVFIAVAHLPFLFLEIFPCQPINYFWTRWDGEHHGHCIDLTLEVWAGAAVTLFLDILLFVVPLPILARLNMSRQRKLEVLVMFSFGLIIVAVSIARIPAIKSFETTTNFTAAYVPTAMWSDIELEVGVIVACLPSLRAIVPRRVTELFKKLRTKPTNISPNSARDHYLTIGSDDAWRARMKGQMDPVDITFASTKTSSEDLQMVSQHSRPVPEAQESLHFHRS
ncbi:hypothetical protein F4808DRAFT_441322 [Astrocystis sublimbata]|nr:hypothetical protein F4808DRAFT_441322 [Astrocystis sublimbata]